jgi:DNA (cytosine-5)-methyltransferase 1
VTRDDVVLKNDVKIEKDEFGNFSQKSIRLGIVNKGGQGERIYSPLGHAITLSAYGGGAGAKTGLYLIDGVIRKLAPRECARITGFPDSFTVDPNKNSAYKQFGNSVVVNVLKSIVENIIKSKCFDEESETHSRFKKAS